MTKFGCPVKNAQDIRVLLVGIICTVLVFTVVTVVGEVVTPSMAYVDLVPDR